MIFYPSRFRRLYLIYRICSCCSKWIWGFLVSLICFFASCFSATFGVMRFHNEMFLGLHKTVSCILFADLTVLFLLVSIVIFRSVSYNAALPFTARIGGTLELQPDRLIYTFWYRDIHGRRFSPPQNAVLQYKFQVEKSRISDLSIKNGVCTIKALRACTVFYPKPLVTGKREKSKKFSQFSFLMAFPKNTNANVILESWAAIGDRKKAEIYNNLYARNVRRSS